MDDIEAVERTLAGDTDAFGALVSRYRSRAYAAALARVYDPQDAQDLVQETFLRAYTRLSMLRDRQKFGPWVFSILRRLSVDFMRGKWRAEQGGQRMESCKDLATSTDPRPEIAAKDTAKTLWALVGQLDDNSREVVSLHYGQQMKVTEIAELTGMRESAVKMRLKKARTVLGSKVTGLEKAWGVAAIPAFSAEIMAAVKAAGPAKAGATAALGSAAGWLGFLAFPAWILGVFGVPAWLGAKDVARWRPHVPAGMEKLSKRNIIRSLLIVIAGSVAGLPLASIISRDARIMSLYSVVIFALLGLVFWREIELLSPREKAKQCINGIGMIVLLILVAFNLPRYLTLAYMGGFFAVQYFLTNKAVLAQGTVVPGCWVVPLLKNAGLAETKPVRTEMGRIRPWLTMLHEVGLVAPPCKTHTDGISVRLRVKNYIGEKMAYGENSTLQTDERGLVSCSITPRDYVALAKHFNDGELPGRRELAEKLGNTFTKAFTAYANGGDKTAVAEALGLRDCPMNVTKTHIFLFHRYVIPFVGILIMAACFIYHFR